MAARKKDQQSLNIPSFLANPRRQNPPVPAEDEVDAVMESVREAAGVESHRETISKEPPQEAKGSNSTQMEAPAPEPEPVTEPESEPEPVVEPEPEPEIPLEDDLKALEQIERHVYAHRYVSTEIETFGETIDPPKVTADRAEVLAILMEETHERMSDPAVGDTLKRLAARSDELEPKVAAQVRILTRDRNQIGRAHV